MNEPKIRFKGFCGEWKNTTFGAFGSVAMCRRIFKEQTSERGDIPFYKIGTFGKEPDAYISRALYEDYKAKYPYPQKGDILISAAGTIGRTVEYKGEDSYFQDSNIVWIKHSDELDNQFLKQLYSIVKWSSLEGATIQRLYNSNILETEVNIPSLPEQRALASFFTSLDAQISASTSRLASLKQVKAASLQAMFPQEGETVPKVRFKGFQGEWKKVVVGGLGYTYSGLTGKSKDDFGIGSAKFITFLNVLNNAQIDTSILDYVDVKKSEHQNEVRKGDLFFNTSSETPEEVGLCSVLKEDVSNVYLNSFCFGFRLTDNNVYPSYIAYLMRSNIGRRIMSILAQGATRYNLSKNNFCKTEIPIPCKSEQQSIASFFTTLDRQIALQSQRLEKLKQIKAACLDKMFV